MAHFAELDESNTVINVVVVHNDVTTIDGVEDEQRGIDFLNDLYPDSGAWVQTSYNHNMRTAYAGLGAVYDADNDRFTPPKPFPSWVLNTDTNDWEAPVAPVPGYYWDEATTSWVQPTSPFPSWTWTDDEWTPPTPNPGTLGEEPVYGWDEDTTSWVEIEE